MSERLATDVITLREAATFVRVSEKTMRELARANKVPGQKVGREWRFLRSALEAWLAHREPAGIVAEPDVQYELPFTAKDAKPVTPGKLATGFGDTAFTKNRNQPLHRWVPWIAGFSSSFVGSVLEAASEKEPRDVTVLDPLGRVCAYGGSRAVTGGRSRFTIHTAVNDPAGRWRVRVQDLITGKTAQATFGLE